MKNISKILLVIVLCLFSTHVYASEKIDVEFSKCVDGDTAYFTLDGRSIKVRFLAIDTPESTTTVEEFGKEASEYTCNALTNASKIQIEYDENSSKTDKYGRTLAWVYVDGELLEEKLVSEGLAEVAYIYNNYSYVGDLCEAEEIAYKKKLNIWENYSWNETYCFSYDEDDGNKINTDIDYMAIIYSFGLLFIIFILYLVIRKVLGWK